MTGFRSVFVDGCCEGCYENCYEILWMGKGLRFTLSECRSHLGFLIGCFFKDAAKLHLPITSGFETPPVEDGDCELLLQTADVAGDEEEREVVYDWMDLFATTCY